MLLHLVIQPGEILMVPLLIVNIRILSTESQVEPYISVWTGTTPAALHLQRERVPQPDRLGGFSGPRLSTPFLPTCFHGFMAPRDSRGSR